LNWNINSVNDSINGRCIHSLALKRTIQIDEMKRLSTSLNPSLCCGDRVTVLRLRSSLTLYELNDITILHIYGWNNLE
jgi:hypothetical protein